MSDSVPPPPAKRSRTTTTDDDDNGNKKKTIDDTVEQLQIDVEYMKDNCETYYASTDCTQPQLIHHQIPSRGRPAAFVAERLRETHELDNRPRLNTSSYVNVVREPEEEDICLMGLSVNLADSSVYPSSVRLHDTVVNMIAKLWHCPTPTNPDDNYSGAGTVGSTEACLLAGLALKFRWRKWYQTKHGLTHEQVIGVVPNMIISSVFQAAWEKFFRYFDVIPRFAKPTLENKMRMDPTVLEQMCDEKTIGVVGILGNHYNGAYDPIWDMNDVIEQINAKHDWQIGIHVDAASGGFIAPFQDNMPPFDFRLKNVLSISSSGHKFGESSCGTGWLVFRRREDLAEHIAVSVTYLGGRSDSITLNFSRPATAVYNQLYKFLRLGIDGYKRKVQNQMMVSKFMRDYLKSQKHEDGQPRYEILDCGDEHCLPVVAARLNPELFLSYNDIDLQHALSEYHWYVSGYSLNFDDFSDGGKPHMLCTDGSPKDTMFRVVVKCNMTMYLAEDLTSKLGEVVPILDKMKGELKSIKRFSMKIQDPKHRRSSYHQPC